MKITQAKQPDYVFKWTGWRKRRDHKSNTWRWVLSNVDINRLQKPIPWTIDKHLWCCVINALHLAASFISEIHVLCVWKVIWFRLRLVAYVSQARDIICTQDLVCVLWTKTFKELSIFSIGIFASNVVKCRNHKSSINAACFENSNFTMSNTYITIAAYRMPVYLKSYFSTLATFFADS